MFLPFRHLHMPSLLDCAMFVRRRDVCAICGQWVCFPRRPFFVGRGYSQAGPSVVAAKVAHGARVACICWFAPSALCIGHSLKPILIWCSPLPHLIFLPMPPLSQQVPLVQVNRSWRVQTLARHSTIPLSWNLWLEPPPPPPPHRCRKQMPEATRVPQGHKVSKATGNRKWPSVTCQRRLSLQRTQRSSKLHVSTSALLWPYG